MANSLSAVIVICLVSSAAAASLVSSETFATTTVTPIADQSNSTPPFNLSRPLLPGLVSTYLLQPLVNLNNQLSQAVSSVPQQLAQSGQTLGTVIALPIQLGTSAANNVTSQLNSTLITLSNQTYSLLQPVFVTPIALVNQANGLALSAVNYSTSFVGQSISNVGETISNTGQDVQHLGDSILKWVDSLEQLRQQLNGINAPSTTLPTSDQSEEVTSTAEPCSLSPSANCTL